MRGERSKTKHHHSQKSAQNVAASTPKQTIVTTKDAAPNTSTNIIAIPAMVASKVKKSSSKATDTPRKMLKKKKRRPSSAEDSGAEKDCAENTIPIKPSRQLKKKSKHKEIIDYSNPEQAHHTNTFGKVQKWLLESPIVAGAASQIEHSSKIGKIMSKSQSTPEQLALNQRSPNGTKTKTKTKSVNNLNEKVRLQVVYKPPFKFSLKLSKNDSSVKTHVLGSSINKSKRKSRMDRKRVQAAASATVDELQRSRRTALLIRSNTEEIANQLGNDIVNEPNYETLNSKLPKHQRQHSLPVDAPTYENISFQSTANLMDAPLSNVTSPVINTATFKINKSASGGNINKRNLPVISTPVMNNSRKTSQPNQLSHSNNNSRERERRSSVSNSNSNLANKFGGSAQNLIRSSTTNLAKNSSNYEIKRRGSAAPHDMNRSSTTNLNKYHRQNSGNGSNSNLRRGNSNVDLNIFEHSGGGGGVVGVANDRKSHSRKNSVNSKSNLPRTFSNSNLQNNINSSCINNNPSNASSNPKSLSSTTSSRRDSFNNIPRASLTNNNNFHRQTSLNVKPSTSTSMSTNRMLVDELNSKRPQTSSCDSSMKHFEWPKLLSSHDNDNILPSDLEVMVSDVENLVSDR